MRKIMVVIMILSFLLCASEIAYAKEGEPIAFPKLEMFTVAQNGKTIDMKIAYTGVAGGLKEAKILMQLTIQSKGKIGTSPAAEYDYTTEKKYEIYANPDNVANGILIVTTTELEFLKNSDKVGIVIVIKDKFGNLSNTMGVALDIEKISEM